MEQIKKKQEGKPIDESLLDNLYHKRIVRENDNFLDNLKSILKTIQKVIS